MGPRQVGHALAIGSEVLEENHDVDLPSARVVMPLIGPVALAICRKQALSGSVTEGKLLAVVPGYDLQEDRIKSRLKKNGIVRAEIAGLK